MQNENKTNMAALFSLDVLASMALLVGMLLDFENQISSHFVGSDETGITHYAFFMVAMTSVAMLILLVNSVTNNGALFIWLAVFYALFAFMSTVFSGMYSAEQLPFRFISISYWVAVMSLSYYSVLHLNTAKWHVAIVILMLPVLFYKFFIMRGQELVSPAFLLLNPVYFISYLMPVVLLLKSRFLKVSSLLLIFVAVVLSYKRMAFLAFSTSILVYFYCLSRSGQNTKSRRIVMAFLGTVAFIAVLAFSFRYLTGAFNLDWAARMSDIAESGGSGRLDLWRKTVTALAADPAHWLLGHGYLATTQLLSTGAHNDVIEIFYDFGLIGLMFYLMFASKLIRIFFEMKRLRYRHFAAFAASLVWVVYGSMFSMLVMYPYWFLGIAMFWGITIADFENTKKQGYLTDADDSSYTCPNNEESAAAVSYTPF